MEDLVQEGGALGGGGVGQGDTVGNGEGLARRLSVGVAASAVTLRLTLVTGVTATA